MFENWDFWSPLAFICQVMKIVFQYDMWHKRGGANLWLNYQFSSKTFYLIIQEEFCILYQLRVGNTVSKHKWGYKLQNFTAAAPPPAPKPITYLHYEKNRTCQQPSPRFARILPIAYALYNIFTIFDQCRYFFTSMIRPWSSNYLWFWATQIPESYPKRVWVFM